tara:strand:+ start:235 stop:492 length:258 start_codon:yes stop_codon:yes gene_type:complete
MAKKRAYNNSNVTAEAFIKAWQTSNTKADVMKKTGMNKNAVSQRAYTYRKRGVPLKNLRGVGARKSPEEWTRLAELAQSFENGDN